jgi:hypothetical protein
MRFFCLLMAATAIPFALLPTASHLVPRNASIEDLTAFTIFLGSGGHVAASFFFYGDPRTRRFMLGRERRARFAAAPLFVILFAAVFMMYSEPPFRSWGIITYWIWQTHHYTRQNQGILSFVSRAEGLSVGVLERTAITLTGIAGIFAMTTFVTPFRETALAGLGWQLHSIGLAVFVVGWGFFLASAWKVSPRAAPLRWCVNGVLMLFYLPLFVFDDMQSGVMTYAIAHGLQYLVFMYSVAAVPKERRTSRLVVLVAVVALGGLLLGWMQQESPWGDLRWAVYGAYLGVVMWHFLLDAGVWRLSEPFQRGYMSERFSFLGTPNRPR